MPMLACSECVIARFADNAGGVIESEMTKWHFVIARKAAWNAG